MHPIRLISNGKSIKNKFMMIMTKDKRMIAHPMLTIVESDT